MERTEGQVRPKFKEMVREASRSLALLDAERLEELALSCQALSRVSGGSNAPGFEPILLEAEEAEQDMAVFARVLAATSANLEVLRRLHDLREGNPEYDSQWGRAWAPAEMRHGDH